MSYLDEIYASYLNAPKQGLVGACQHEIVVLTDLIVASGMEEDSAREMLIGAFANFCCLDGKIQYDEYNFFKAVFLLDDSISYDNFFDLCSSYNTSDNRDVLRRNSQRNRDFARHLGNIGCCICAADGNFTDKEKQYLEYMCDL